MFTLVFTLCIAAGPGLTAEAEQRQVTEHLRGAEALLRARTPPGLDARQAEKRADSIHRLHEYIVAAVYPANPDFAQPTPYFIDASGTRCAMAYLIEVAGGGALVQKIASERNNARIVELVDEPELVAWLSANGLTVEEAARVQPEYPPRCEKLRALAYCEYAPATAVELRVVTPSSADAGTIVRMELAVGQPLSWFPVGSEQQLDPYAFHGYLPHEVGDRFFALVPPLGRFELTQSIDSQGYVVLHQDAACRNRPVVTTEEIGGATQLPDEASCIKELEHVDPHFGETICYRSNPGPIFCGADGELTAETRPGPLGCTCSSASGSLAALGLLVVARRFRRYRQS